MHPLQGNRPESRRTSSSAALDALLVRDVHDANAAEAVAMAWAPHEALRRPVAAQGLALSCGRELCLGWGVPAPEAEANSTETNVTQAMPIAWVPQPHVAKAWSPHEALALALSCGSEPCLGRGAPAPAAERARIPPSQPQCCEPTPAAEAQEE